MVKTNLIYLHPHFTLPGGAGNVVLEVASQLDPSKYSIHILCIRVDKQYREKYPSLSFVEIGGPLSDSPFFWLTFPCVQSKVHKALYRFRPDIVIASVLPANWWAFIYKLLHEDVACVWYCHEPSAFIHIPEWIESIQNPLMRLGAKLINPVLKMIDLVLARNAPDAVVNNSQFSRSLYQRTYKKELSAVLYPGVDLDVFFPRGEKQPYLLMVSRLTRFKNIQVALEAMTLLKDQEHKLIIGGEGEEKENLVALSKELGISRRVHFLGSVPYTNLPNLYTQAKLMLFTNENEPFGMVPVEALACGTPVVAMNSGGVKETVTNGHNGILLDKMTPENLANVLDGLLSDSAKYALLRANARSSAKQFSWEEHVQKLERVLDGFVQGDQTPRSVRVSSRTTEGTRA